jgi:hypothetical protein
MCGFFECMHWLEARTKAECEAAKEFDEARIVTCPSCRKEFIGNNARVKHMHTCDEPLTVICETDGCGAVCRSPASWVGHPYVMHPERLSS